MRRIAIVTVGLLIAGFMAAPPSRAATAATVDVRSNAFSPQETRVEVNGTVQWRVVDGGHTVTSDDKEGAGFDFPGSDEQTSTLTPGEVREFTFAREGVYYFHCEIHGTDGLYPYGMTGVVYVGVDPATVVPQTRRVPSRDHPTITSALDGAPSGSTVLVDPGTYTIDRELQVETKGLRLRPTRTGRIVLNRTRGPDDGDGASTVGVVVGATDVRIERVTVTGHGWAGVLVDPAAANVRLDDVETRDGPYGIRWLGGKAGGINRPVVRGATRAGVSIAECGEGHFSCPHVLGGSIVGDGSRGAGVAVERSAGVTISGTSVDRMPTGIDVDRGTAVLVTGNTVTGARAAAISVRGPSTDVRIVDNRANDPGLSWDGIGVGVCFSGNRRGDGSASASSPPELQRLVPCA